MKKWLLPLLCGLPVIGVVLWFVAGKNVNNLLTLGIFLACPLSHLFLMRHGGNENNDHRTESNISSHGKGVTDHKKHQSPS